jgi:hypothetical protein
MPTNLDRIQVLLQPDTFASVQTLGKHNRRSGSAMCAELIEAALKLPKYRSQVEEALIQVPAKEDPRSAAPQVQLRKAERTTPSYKGLIPEKEEVVVEQFGLDKIPPERIKELQALLAVLETANKEAPTK